MDVVTWTAMTEAPRYVHIVDEVPELAGSAGRPPGPVLVVALDGFLDAGNAGRLAVDHLLGDDPGRVVASFDIDAFYDYRARRPPMAFVEDHYEGYAPPRLVVRLQHDSRGAPYLLLHGPEPDTHWEAFARSVREVVEHFGVRLTVSLGSVPMAVPHTPAGDGHQPRHPARAARARRTSGAGVIQVPASALAMLELRLGEWGHDAMGFVAHVPHYVAQVGLPRRRGQAAGVPRGRHRAASGSSTPLQAAAADPRRRDRRAGRRLRRGAGGRRRARAAVRRVHPRRRRRGPAAGRGA